MKVELIEALEYDHWATSQWLAAWDRWQDPTKANEVLAHLLGAKRIWLARCSGEDAPPEEDALHEAWLRAVCGIEATRVFAYRTSTGMPFETPFEQIVRHLVNHGSYHRGEFRRLAAEGGMTDWPETDLILFYRQRDQQAR